MIDYDRIPYTPKASTGEHVRTNAFYNPVDEPETHGGRYERRKPMDEYISRQTAIDALEEQIALCDKVLKSFGISMKDEYAVKVERTSLAAYKEQLEAIPAANVVPVVHGAWLDGYKMQTCSLCKCRGKKSWTFCPHCGARMISARGRKHD